MITFRGLNFTLRLYSFRFTVKLFPYRTHYSLRASLLPLRSVKSSRIYSTSLEKGQVRDCSSICFTQPQNIVVHLPSVTDENLELLIDDHSDTEATLIILKGTGSSSFVEPLRHKLQEMNLIVLSTSVDDSETHFSIVDQDRNKVRKIESICIV